MRPAIQIFAEAMEKKLQRDDSVKCPWETTSLAYLYKRLLDEVEELADAHFESQKMDECCDVANFAMMIFSKLHPDTRHLIRGRQQEPGTFVHGDPDGMPSDVAIMRGRL